MSSPGRSATSGSRLFMSILSGASVNQLLALSSVPRGLRTTRILSMRAGAVMDWTFHATRQAVISRSHRASKAARLSTGYGDEAIQEPLGALRSLDCFASLAMTIGD